MAEILLVFPVRAKQQRATWNDTTHAEISAEHSKCTKYGNMGCGTQFFVFFWNKGRNCNIGVHVNMVNVFKKLL